MRPSNRKLDEMRPVSIEINITNFIKLLALICCFVFLSNDLPLYFKYQSNSFLVIS